MNDKPTKSTGAEDHERVARSMQLAEQSSAPRFEFEGRSYQLFKRINSKEAPWYIQLKKKNIRYKRSLDTNNVSQAIKLAKALIKAIKAENWSGVTETKQHRDIVFPTIGEVYALYLRHAGEIKARSAKNNTLALNVILRTVFGITAPTAKPADRTAAAYIQSLPAGIRNCSTEKLDRQVVRKFKQLWVEKFGVSDEEEDEDEDEEELRRAKGTASSYLGQGRSVFARHMLEIYHDEGLKFPETLREFMEALPFRGIVKTEYNAPSEELLAKTFAALEKLRETDEPAYTAICLACGAGLRKGEAIRAKWDWFKVSKDGVVLDSNAIGKDGLVIKNVPVIEEWWKRLQAVRVAQLERGEKGSSILPGHYTERSEEIFRRIGSWMRALGWKTQKTIHEFRAYAGSKVAEQYGIEAASMFLRHKDTRTTRTFYLRYVEMKKITLKGFGAAA